MQRQRLSIAVADLHQYAPLLQAIGLGRSVALLEEAYVAVGDIALKRGGRIRKYVGELFEAQDSASLRLCGLALNRARLGGHAGF